MLHRQSNEFRPKIVVSEHAERNTGGDTLCIGFVWIELMVGNSLTRYKTKACRTTNRVVVRRPDFDKSISVVVRKAAISEVRSPSCSLLHSSGLSEQMARKYIACSSSLVVVVIESLWLFGQGLPSSE